MDVGLAVNFGRGGILNEPFASGVSRKSRRHNFLQEISWNSPPVSKSFFS